MAAYRAEIEVGVSGVRSLEQLRSQINKTATAVDSLNDVVSARGSLVQNIQNYTSSLNRASESLQKVGAGTAAETKAIREYVRALGEANTARARQNSLVAQEIANQRRVSPQTAPFGQQGPALPPALVKNREIQQAWNTFFTQAQQVAQELQSTASAKQLNIRTSWSKFFTDAQQIARDTQNIAAAKSVNLKNSWSNFFAEAQQVAVDLNALAQQKANAIRSAEQQSSAAARQRLSDESARRQRIRDAGFGAQGPAAPPQQTQQEITRTENNQKRLNNLLASAQVIEQRILQYKHAGIDLSNQEAQVKRVISSIQQSTNVSTRQYLSAVDDTLNTLRNELKVRKAIDQTAKSTASAGFGVQGPAVPPAGIRKPSTGGVKGGLGFNPAATAENLALGAGFPLLFGGGAGQVAGGLAGSFFGEGFGGQILGSAIGQQLEDATRRITEIGTALNQLNMDALRDSAILVNAELTNQVRLLQGAGRADEARAAIAREVTLQTGLLPEAVSDITNNTNLLGNTWNEFLGAVSGTLSIISAPFVSALTFILQGLAKALQGINFIATGLASIVRSVTEWAAKTLGLNGLLGVVKNQTTAISEEEQKRVAALQKLTDGQLKEIQNNQKNLQLESQRTLGRTTAEKQINAEIDKQQANDKIRLEYEEKAKQIREEFGDLTSEQVQDALRANSALEQQALKHQAIKDLLVQQRAEIEANTEKYGEAAEAVQRQIEALDRGNAVTQSRYSAEAALNDLYAVQLQRQYELATTAQQRFNIAIAMFQQQIRAAQLEYEQALNNNVLLVEKAKLEANLVEIKYKQLEAEKAIAIAQAKSRGNTPEQIRSIADAYDKGLGLQREAVQAAYDQVQATVEIANNQNVVADAIYKTKVVQAESELAQKLVSKEIGMSESQAQRLAGSLANGVFRANEMSSAMYNVAQQAANAAQQIQNAINLQNMLRNQGNQNGGAPQQAAEGAYWSGGFKAFADGGVVSQPTLGLVGEGGESEYIIPASKMDEAMARYASGQRGSSVIPSSINPQVNVTTGPVMNMNGNNYVSQNDFMTGMQTASRRGAEMALQALQGSNSVRRAVGIG